jgi:hypothetical protein
MLRKIFPLVALFFMVANFCYAEANVYQRQLEKCIQNVFENEQYCVYKIEDNKVYIKSENIIPTEQGILIDLNGFEKTLAPALFSDSGGSFLEDIRPMWSEIIPRCSSCKEPIYNGVCNNPNCKRYGR